MILQALNELYGRLEKDPAYLVAPVGSSLQKIAFEVVIREDGTLVDIQDTRVLDGKKLKPKQLLVPGSAKPSGSGINPCFLWDNTSYMLGFKDKDPKPKRTQQAHDAFAKKHQELVREIDSPSFAAVCSFLENWNPEDASNYPALADATGFGVFRIVGRDSFVHEDAAVRRWLENAEDQGELSHQGECLVSMENAQIAKTHPSIKGVVGAQSSGAAIVSFNDNAYESFGLTQSYNAPISEKVAFRYTTALNALLDGPMKTKHRLRVGDSSLVFWTDKPTAVEDVFAQFLSEGSSVIEDDSETQDEAKRQKLQIFLEALRKGTEAYGDLGDDVEETNFYVLALSPNAARVSVRFFQRSSISEFLDHLRKHQQDMKIEGRPATAKSKGDPEFLPTWMLLAQTARESKEIPPILSGSFLRAILTGTRYPQALYDAVLRRIRADREVNYARACIIKGFLVRNHHMEVPMSLDIARQDPGYRLGRLFAALEKTQMDGLGLKINATIRDRYYSSASATPGTVFPRLLRTYQHHLAKMEGGFKVNREKLVQEILDPLTSFPTHLNLEGQGLFALGYYQQTKDFYRSKKDKAETEVSAA